jgi:hypothetical protein
MNELLIDLIAIKEIPMEWALLARARARDDDGSVAKFNRFRTEKRSFVEDVLW